MRILFVNEKLGYFGGVEQNVADAALLRERGHECLLAHGGSLGRDAAGYSRLFDGVVGFSDVAGLRPDVVYVHKAPSIRPFLGPWRTVRMMHDHDLWCPRRHKYYLMSGKVCGEAAGWRCLLDGAFLERSGSGVRFVDVGARLRELRDNRSVDHVIVASRYMRQQLEVNGFPLDRVSVVAPAVRNPVSASPVPATRTILYVGQLIRGKGVDLLLQAAAGLRGDFSLTVIGDGNARPALETQVSRLGLTSRVRFVGWVPPTALPTWYQQSRAAVVPSRWPEPYGLVGLDAMTHARPVVAFNVGGIPDWLTDGETGFLVPEQDVPAMTSALQRLLDDDALAARLGAQAAAWISQHRTLEAYLEDLESVLAPKGELASAGQLRVGPAPEPVPRVAHTGQM